MTDEAQQIRTPIYSAPQSAAPPPQEIHVHALTVASGEFPPRLYVNEATAQRDADLLVAFGLNAGVNKLSVSTATVR